jgi:IclR helix-turn-helix domain
MHPAVDSTRDKPTSGSVSCYRIPGRQYFAWVRTRVGDMFERKEVRKMRRKGKVIHRISHDKNFVAVTQKVFSILEALSQQPKSGVALDELTQFTGIAKTTVFRLLYSMVKLGYVDQDPVTNLYALSGRFFELGTNALPYQRLTVIAKPLMQTLLLTDWPFTSWCWRVPRLIAWPQPSESSRTFTPHRLGSPSLRIYLRKKEKKPLSATACLL